MPYKGLFVFVEGPDDDRFVGGVLEKLFKKEYDWVKTYLHAGKKPAKISTFLRSIQQMQVDYIFLTDLDLAPCITLRKEASIKKYGDLDPNRIVVVAMEIEGWYLAGCDTSAQDKIRLSSYDDTSKITKEQFNQMIPRGFLSRIDFMKELLKNYSVEVAQKQNFSFNYLASKYLP